MAPTLKHQTVTGIKWLVGSSFLQKGISLCATIVLARILGPSQFGLFALAFVAIDALGLFKSMGFDSALIQRKDNIEKAANTAFFIIPLLGILLYIILAVSAPLIGKFMNNQEVVGVIRALGIIFVISCFGKVPSALMEKNMQFKQVSIIEVSTAVVYSVSAVVFALLGFRVWSLVLAYILKTINQNALFFILSGWRPKFEFDRQISLEMFHFGKYLFLGGVIFFLKMNLDNLLVAKVLGVTALGIYAVAFNLANFGADYFGGKIYRVIVPAFSKIQNDQDDLKRAFLKTTKLLSIFAFPFCMFLFVFGDVLIRICYGTKWLEAIPALRILAFAGLFNTLPCAMAPLFIASGHSKAGFLFTSIQIGLFIMLIVPAAKMFGLPGVAFVVVFSQLFSLLVYMPFTLKLISAKWQDIIVNLMPGAISSLAFAFVAILFKAFSLAKPDSLGFYITIATSVVSACVIFYLCIRLIDRNISKEIIGFIVT